MATQHPIHIRPSTDHTECMCFHRTWNKITISEACLERKVLVGHSNVCSLQSPHVSTSGCWYEPYSIIYSQNNHISITYTFSIGKEENEEKKKHTLPNASSDSSFWAFALTSAIHQSSISSLAARWASVTHGWPSYVCWVADTVYLKTITPSQY